jgi:hypothetical protein
VSLQDHGIFTNLRGTVCACGGEKNAGKSFCRADYFKLPREMRAALYQRAGYADAFRAALAFLSLSEPTSDLRPPTSERQPTLRDVFPDRGPIRRNPYRLPIR